MHSFSIRLAIWSFSLGIQMTHVVCSCNSQENRSVTVREFSKTQIHGLICDSHVTLARVDFGSITVDSTGISKVVGMGEVVLPTVLQIMADKKESFDTFVKCYSVCEQILKTRDKELPLFWGGGCAVIDDPVKGSVFAPSGQGNVRKFRLEVYRTLLEYCRTSGVIDTDVTIKSSMNSSEN